MLTYRGDKFVRGKKFIINETEYYFSKYDADKTFLIFEDTNKKSLRISKEDYDKMKRYKLIEADSDKLDEFYNGSSLTFEGCTTDEKNLDYLYEWLGELNALKEGTLPIYTYKGSLMNEKYGLTGDNAYPDDLNFITVMLDDINYTDNLAFKRFEIGGRWFDDIVENNRYRQGNINESFTIIKESLLEKVNLDNKEINDIIGKVLNSKSTAKKYEDQLKSYGIDIDYDSKSQGVILKGPNGKTLSATSKYIEGPSEPNQNRTHYKDNNIYNDLAQNYKQTYDELKAMKKKDIIKNYGDMESYNDRLDSIKNKYKDYMDQAMERNSEYKAIRRKGHLWSPGSTKQDSFIKSDADSKVDYLNYLIKPNYGKDFRDDNFDYHIDGQDRDGDYRSYPVKNPVNNSKSPDIETYKRLKDTYEADKEMVRDKTYSKNDSMRKKYGYMTNKQLKDRTSEMKDELNKKIANLRKEHEKEVEFMTKDNARRKEDLDVYRKDLNASRKKLRDFMKAKREKRVKNESVELTESVDSAYIDQRLNAIYDEVLTLAQEAQHSGFNEISDKLNDVLGILDYTKVG